MWKIAPSAFVSAECTEMWSLRRAHGAVRAGGGTKTAGIWMNGTWPLILVCLACDANARKAQAFGHNTGSTGFITMRPGVAGLCGGSTIDVHGTPCAVRVQFS